MIEFLKEEKVSPELIEAAEDFAARYPVNPRDAERIPVPEGHYYGKEIWEQALAALLCGQNLLLSGPKASGKNLLAENLAAVFGRPVWNISFHINMDAASLIGTDTFRDGAVSFRQGPVACCAVEGGFGILDEVNMAKNEALAVLHSALDFRRSVDVPGYDRIPLKEETRFIGTMNYGYAGTRELNEALTSRFAVISMPVISGENLERLLKSRFPRLNGRYAGQLVQLFADIRAKCENGEISSRPLDLRGLLDALSLAQRGLDLHSALDMGLTNKSFDPYEQGLVRDMIRGRIPKKLNLWDGR
ncbi:MAG: MoxR family ATPase [Eubacteriales bacterium]|nr:MoxR family ATPase [Eubacteriales bacterium]